MEAGRTWKILLLLAFFYGKGDSNQCALRHVGIGGIVCVCNATYCDSTPDVEPKVPPKGSYYWYVSTSAGYRLQFYSGQFGSCETVSPFVSVLNVDTTERYQTILGFGGAFTDSAGINIKKLSNATQENLLRSYFDKDGSRYNLGRVPIGASDFSTRTYTYDDHDGDVTLQHFSLAKEDYEYKIPFIRRAKELSPDIRLLSAAWTAPSWMKTIDSPRAFLGFLKPQYYQLYADYIVKFLDEYKKEGIDIWSVSTGNEPSQSFLPLPTINSMAWTPNTAAFWVAENLGPTLASSLYNGTVILGLDDERIELPWAVQLLFTNEKAKNYISGIGVHVYTDPYIAPEVLTDTHNDFPDKFILVTESTLGFFSLFNVLLGSWLRGATYMLDIMQYLNHWTVGWVDFNLALDKSGGPTWAGNTVDASIIVNPENDEFFKQPMYYALKHFSRFVPRGSVRIFSSESLTIKTTSFLTPSNEVVIVLYNSNFLPAIVSLNDSERGTICLNLPALSMNTVIYT